MKSIDSTLETIDSREIARQTGEQHQHVLRNIRTMIKYIETSPNLDASNYFIKSTYVDKANRTKPCYLLTRMGCEMYVNKLSGKKGTLFTAFYVSRFNEMEQQIQSPFGKFAPMIPTTLPEALRLSADLQEQVNKLEPKAKWFDKFMNSNKLFTPTVIASHYGKSAQWLNKFLHEKHVIYFVDGCWIPYQPYKDKGYADIRYFDKDIDKDKHVSSASLKWFPKGVKFIDTLMTEQTDLDI